MAAPDAVIRTAARARPPGPRRIDVPLMRRRHGRGQQHASARETAPLRSNFDLGIAVDTWMKCDADLLDRGVGNPGRVGASARIVKEGRWTTRRLTTPHPN